MRISIIVPVYNAAVFVRAAVESALVQPETQEVVLVEDSSQDDSLAVCRALVSEYDRVKLFTHPGHVNRGAGASRNLAIKNASCDWVAFLDADDVYCDGRFSHISNILQGRPEIDGVYDATGVIFENEQVKKAWYESKRPLLTTMTRVVLPETLFEEMAPIGTAGYWHLDGWLVRKSLLLGAGLFDEHLRLHQDTVLCLKAAAIGRLVPGNLETPAALRRVHDHNRITARRTAAEDFEARCLMWATLWRWAVKQLCARRRRLTLRRWLDYVLGLQIGGGPLEDELEKLRMVLGLLTGQPVIALESIYWQKVFIQFMVMVHTAARRG